jgi:predicted RNase H-related nuclease YkuK (DUF458 family)
MGKKEKRSLLKGADNPVWKKFTGEVITGDLKDAIIDTIKDERENGFNIKHICLGTDSKLVRGKAVFVTTILFVRDRRGAFSFYFKEAVDQYRDKGISKTDKKFIKRRMMDEAQRTIDITYSLMDTLNAYNIDFEIHLDMNSSERHSSYLALKEAIGYVQGMGWKAVVKPESIAATYVADRRAK